MSDKEEQLDREIFDKAFEWAIDYKPWEEDLPYRDYASYGYQQGYKQALKDLQENK